MEMPLIRNLLQSFASLNTKFNNDFQISFFLSVMLSITIIIQNYIRYILHDYTIGKEMRLHYSNAIKNKATWEFIKKWSTIYGQLVAFFNRWRIG